MLLKVWREVGVTERVPQPLASVVVRSGWPPLFFRYNTHDYYVIWQILANGDYDVLGPDKNPRLIVDCGANIVATARFFLQKYPDCHVVSVEPGESNAEGFGPRAQVLLASVWGEETPLKIGRAPNQVMAGSMMEVRPARSGEKPDMMRCASTAYSTEQASREPMSSRSISRGWRRTSSPVNQSVSSIEPTS
jgi:hypothetical protein